MAIRPVFHDPSGRRGRIVRALLGSAAIAVVVLGGTFAVRVLRPPVVKPLPINTTAATDVHAPDGSRGPSRLATSKVRPLPVSQHASSAAIIADPIVAAFAVQWDAGSRAALERVGSRLDWVIVEGAFLGRGKPGEITVTLDDDLLASARKSGAHVHLMLTNFGASGFDSSLVSSVVAHADRRAAAVAMLTQLVERKQLGGITVDFELVPTTAHPQVLTFIRELRDALAPMGAVVSAAVPVGEGDGYPLRAYGEAVDYLIPMLYDEHGSVDVAGPVASSAWFAQRLDAVLDVVPGAKIIAGVGQYGYHWRSDRPEVAANISVSEAMALSRAATKGPLFDAASRNPTAQWRDANGVSHQVWYLDAATAWNQLHVSFRSGVAGAAFWRLGSEDATVWRLLDRSGLVGTTDSLTRLPNDGVSVLVGDGEVLAVEGHTGTGERTISMDRAGYIDQETIRTAPGGYLVSRGGHHARRIALTFDDGPDADWTGPILDTLASRQALASFFVVGRQVQRLPELTRRIANEGHEIGNHSWSHPDMAGLRNAAIKVELAATGRVIEAVTGRRPLLFRPPYIGDARPSSEERLRPMAVANELGYRVVGLEVDTKDWFETDPNMVVSNALRDVRRNNGRVILLHDAGGDRSSTLAALGPLIDSLRASGFELTTVAGLLDAAPQAGSQTAPMNEAPQRAMNVAAMFMATFFERAVAAAFLVALVLGVIRLLLIGTLATVQRFRKPYARRAADADWRPRVSVLVPAYNEGKVIGRTVHSVLAQKYPDLEVVVVDDGSSDDTSDAASHATDDARLYVVRQTNAGKAAALNTGIAMATGEVIVVIDADTILAPDAIRHLVRPLADSRVGAVAGNAKVGNRINLLTRWQAVEYVTSQNLDRRAFVMLNCITVVPGAIGAWRRSAVLAAGGFRTDTLAEDQDLTLTLLRGGHKVALAEQAVALTEAPETFGALLKQRFRWSFGTLQCAWKHRGALMRRDAGALGMVGLPNIWLFQLLFPLLAPAADVALLASLARLLLEAPALGVHAAWAHAQPVFLLYALFLLIDTFTAVLGVAFEKGESLSQALLVPLQRVAYRQVLYVALLKAMRAAVKGWAPGWGKLERTGRVQALPHVLPTVLPQEA